ncbi:DUF4238 domain-containing protein [Vibrio parahaemolyticus]|uniref:DUF4238 domain-containing protein n=6 Tax=Vibrio parahaemolyticus TaxID=670 RepID=UPI0004D3444F|nr:DUF4238 domain-containing protein [Vibrio parahaemolyticus]HDM8172425.1 DUF4238 domain-containing protein [Vibrio harveyi]EKB1992535.1 DUF4238 domain-containing protein [Vibrio parahaemolyticus]EME0136021.1 DUF4238 domain-containing protein [Vibrio parahaemolyticus]MCQ9044348.1 DUF4238 domain-containing protein [Vibrio parahaemolyticus]MCX8769065.1 DUF4238 domain-containing protein [Vibrio parahaemolyticus]
MKNTTRNQHFVPRCLLKNFTSDDNVVNIYDSYRGKLRNPTSIDRVLAENYFYDRDNVVENFLAEYIEEPASRVLKMFRGESNAPLDSKAQIDLLRFIVVQLNRTPSALSTTLNTLYSLMNEVIKQLGAMNNFSEDVINSIEFSLNDPKDILRMQTVESVLHCPLILDLEWHFLVNDTNTEFIISDHPVVHYNWYLRNLNEMDATGITKRGTQIFLPLSSRVTLCLYDKQVYKIGDKGSTYTVVDNTDDIRLLNELQFRSRDSYIVFTSRKAADYVKGACDRISSNSLYRHEFDSKEPIINGDEARSIIAQWRSPHIFSRWFSFSKIKKKFAKRAICNVDRCPDIVMVHRQEMEALRQREKAL